MSKIEPEILKKLKQCAKDEESFRDLEALFDEYYSKAFDLAHQLKLLEYAIRNDYDSILITELDLDRPGPTIVYVNEGFTHMTGYTKEEVIGKTPRILQGPKTDRAILERLKRRLIEGQAFFGHTINYRKDGTEFINQWDIHPLMNYNGEVTHWVSYQRDVTEKKETAKAIFNTDFDALLKRKEEFTLKFTRDGGDIICKYVNESFEEITGLEKDGIFDSGLNAVLHTDDIPKVTTALENAFGGKESTELCRYKTTEDEFISVYQSFKPVFEGDSNIVKTVKSVAKLELEEI